MMHEYILGMQDVDDAIEGMREGSKDPCHYLCEVRALAVKRLFFECKAPSYPKCSDDVWCPIKVKRC